MNYNHLVNKFQIMKIKLLLSVILLAAALMQGCVSNKK